MSTRQERKLEREKFEALEAYALKYDLEPRFDHGRLGNSPPERAFHLLCCGFDMLIVLMASGFPSLDRRTMKNAAKWTREALVWNGANAAGFTARVCATLFAEMRGRLGDGAEDDVDAVEEPQFHLSLRRSVEDFFPLFQARRAAAGSGQVDPLVEACEAEFEVMRTGKPRKEVADGTEPANEYSLALLHGEDPNHDPELVALQRRYARDYFIYRAARGATQTSMFDNDVARLQPKTIPFLDPNDPRLSDYRARALSAWMKGSRPYREYALIEFRNAAPSERQKWASAATG
jgi:hypothetical protein